MESRSHNSGAHVRTTWDEAGAGLCVPALASWISLGQPARFGVIPMRIVSGWG